MRLGTLSLNVTWTSPTTSASLWSTSQVDIPISMLQLPDLLQHRRHRLPDPDRRDLHLLQRHRQGLRFAQKPLTVLWHQAEWKLERSPWRTSRSTSTRLCSLASMRKDLRMGLHQRQPVLQVHLRQVQCRRLAVQLTQGVGTVCTQQAANFCQAFMAIKKDEIEEDCMVAVIDTGCNLTCHGSQ